MEANQVKAKYALIFKREYDLAALLKSMHQDEHLAAFKECVYEIRFEGVELQVVVVERKRFDTPHNNLLAPMLPERWRQLAVGIIELDTLAGYCMITKTIMEQHHKNLQLHILAITDSMRVYQGPLGLTPESFPEVVKEIVDADPPVKFDPTKVAKLKHVLMYPHRTDLSQRLCDFRREAHLEAFVECVNILGFDGVLYKLLTVDLPYPMEIAGPKDLMLHPDWRKGLIAAYKLEDGQVRTVIPHPEDDRKMRLFFNTFIDHLPAYTGPMGYAIGLRQQPSS